MRWSRPLAIRGSRWCGSAAPGAASRSGAGISEEDHANPGASGTPADVLDAANRAVRSIVNLPQPVVAVVQGPAAGVGASLALACDVVLASEKAFFMLAFTKIGLMPDGGASALIAAAVGRIRAMRMALLAERISAAEAFEWGLVTAVYPADEFDAEVDTVISTLVSGPAVALRKTKNAINAATLMELEAALEREKQGQLVLIDVTRFPRGHPGLPAAQAGEVHRLLTHSPSRLRCTARRASSRVQARRPAESRPRKIVRLGPVVSATIDG